MLFTNYLTVTFGKWYSSGVDCFVTHFSKNYWLMGQRFSCQVLVKQSCLPKFPNFLIFLTVVDSYLVSLTEVTCYLIRSITPTIVKKVIPDRDSTSARGSDFIRKVFSKKCNFMKWKKCNWKTLYSHETAKFLWFANHEHGELFPRHVSNSLTKYCLLFSLATFFSFQCLFKNSFIEKCKFIRIENVARDN